MYWRDIWLLEWRRSSDDDGRKEARPSPWEEEMGRLELCMECRKMEVLWGLKMRNIVN